VALLTIYNLECRKIAAERMLDLVRLVIVGTMGGNPHDVQVSFYYPFPCSHCYVNYLCKLKSAALECTSPFAEEWILCIKERAYDTTDHRPSD
jgi:hypothetical protein